ncbi:conserved hypothetical protein [Ricinus communis]|uniref:Uncharacterized protein n=1 Tax=Ricinus communis TaxID=3988 RepID=B9TC59_RICCO|nr:conserved hypothetical protein [Ricinus communis]EEF26555.1 conserved hypothetical protein [Ricinus communis]
MDSSSSKFGGVDTLARIRVTATREKSKGNCTRPGMDGGGGSTRSVKFRRKTVGSRWRPFFGPLQKEMRGRGVKLGRGFENRVGSCP